MTFKEVKFSSKARPVSLTWGLESRFTVVFLPLLIVTVLSFSFMQMKSASIQKSLASSKGHTDQSLQTSASDLKLITQPSTPLLITEGLSGSEAEQTQADMSGQSVGPASKNAAKSLQGAANTNSMGSDKNDQLQATRKKVPLDNLDL